MKQMRYIFDLLPMEQIKPVHYFFFIADIFGKTKHYLNVIIRMEKGT